MKTKLSILLILSLFGLSSQSQNINVGALLGINASQVSGDGYRGFYKAGVLVGFYSNFDVSEKFNFQFEVNYSEKGSRRNPITDQGDTDFFLLRMNYIEVPIMLRMHQKKFTYEVGTYFSQLVHDYIENENGEFRIQEEWNQLKNNDLGVLIGFNYNVTEALIMNWRFSNSIIPFRNYDSGASFQFDSGLMHNYISFTLRYEFIGEE